MTGTMTQAINFISANTFFQCLLSHNFGFLRETSIFINALVLHTLSEFNDIF